MNVMTRQGFEHAKGIISHMVDLMNPQNSAGEILERLEHNKQDKPSDFCKGIDIAMQVIKQLGR